MGMSPADEWARKALKTAQDRLVDRLLIEAEALGQVALDARRKKGMPDPDPDAWSRRWLNFAHAREFLHLAMMIPGTNLHEAPDTLREMLAHPVTDQPATIRDMVALWRFTTPLAHYRVPWHDTPGGPDTGLLGFHDTADWKITAGAAGTVEQLAALGTQVTGGTVIGRAGGQDLIVPDEVSGTLTWSRKNGAQVAEGKPVATITTTITLDVPELGQVHETIMNTYGAIPQHDSVEIARGGKRDNGVYLTAPPLKDWEEKSLVLDKNKNPRTHKAGVFCIIPGGKSRQRSASFYTPAVLADFLVAQGLDQLEQERDMPAEKWLEISLLEPSVGSGAILTHAIRHVADRYLTKRQEELGRTIPADEYPVELQKVKRHIALHQAHGVDLNTNAVKVAELALWADTLIPKKKEAHHAAA